MGEVGINWQVAFSGVSARRETPGGSEKERSLKKRKIQNTPRQFLSMKNDVSREYIILLKKKDNLFKQLYREEIASANHVCKILEIVN